MKSIRFASQTGQELIEFALIIPIMALIVFGTLDIGRAVYYYSTMSNAAREGARYGSIRVGADEIDNTRDAEICSVVVDWSIAVPLTCDDIDIDVDFDAETVEVTVNYAFDPVTPLIASFFDSSTVDMAARSTMYLEYVPID